MAGTKIKDEEQQYQYTYPFVTPSGHEFSFYDTPDNQRLVVKHTSGSHIEFKSDGSVFIKSVKDLHMHGSVKSSQGASSDANKTTQRFDADLTLDIGGRLNIKCSELNIESGSIAKIKATTDLTLTGNLISQKATESISLEGTKSVYIDTKEMRERIVSRQSESGTKESEGKGGVNIMKVHGNTVIQNDDPNGGITIASQGYLNLVCGKERIDLIGKFTDKPSTQGRGTFTTKVFAPKPVGVLDVAKAMPGDSYFESEAGMYQKIATKLPGSNAQPGFALTQMIQTGNMLQRVEKGTRIRYVGGGLEAVTVLGIQQITAKMIFLN